jgi:hypothetical protein
MGPVEQPPYARPRSVKHCVTLSGCPRAAILPRTGYLYDRSVMDRAVRVRSMEGRRVVVARSSTGLGVAGTRPERGP